MKMFELLPRPLGSIFRKLTHLTCNSRFGIISSMNKKLKTTLLAWPAITAATIALCWFTNFMANAMDIAMPAQQSLGVVLNSRGWRLAANLALIVVAAPVLEETIFRWALWRLPTRLIRGDVALSAAIVSSALFSAAHYVQAPFPDNAFIALFFFGLMQCELYRRTESLWCPMLQHALFNAVNIALLFAFPSLAEA